MNRRAEGPAATAQIAGFSTILMNCYLPDFVNTARRVYLSAGEGPAGLVSGRDIIDRQTVGQNLPTSDTFHTFQASAKVQAE